ncbi:Sfi1 spindle body protein-domain-containing protein [Butyriboletus roseoflavus]|nr:Sfi1 spindle body protein-domain-containing protein [Butyriboletus roseoflavus]
MSSSAIGPDGKVYCKHMEEAAKRISYTSRHPNREFYCCKRPRADQSRCDFWYWADDLPKDSTIPASGSSSQPPKEGASTRAHPTSAPRTRPLREQHEGYSPSNNPLVIPRSRKRLVDIEAGLRQREVDLSPTRHPGPSREPGPSTSFSLAQAIIPQPPSPVPTEVDCEDEAQPQKTYSFLGLHYSPESIVSAIKDEGQPSTPKKQRLIPPTEDTVVQPAADAVSSGSGLLPTPPQTIRRVTQSDEPEFVSAIMHSRKGKEREGRPPVQTQDQNGGAQYDPCEIGESGELQEDYLPLFTLAEDVSTTSSASPTTAENVLDYTDGMKARVKALSEYMDSFDITQAVKMLQTVERQKIQYEYRDRSQKMRIEELAAEKDELVAEVSRLKETLRRPAHTSSPAKSLLPTAPSSLTISDASRASAVSKSELQALSPTELDFLDAVIRRIAPNATSFLSGLKAYNDELHERGLDSQTETVHYGRLLEICKLRGPSWQVKWDGVKKQYGYGTVPPRTAPRLKTPPQPRQTSFPRPTRSAAYLMPPVRDDDDDVFTLHSHQDRDETEVTEDTEQAEEDQEECSSDTERDDEPAHYGITRRRQPQGTSQARPSNPPVSRVANPILPPSLIHPATPRPQYTYQEPIRRVPTWEGTSDTTDGIVLLPSNTPPSYRSATVRTGPTSKSAAVEHRNNLIPRAPSPIKLPKPEPHVQPTLPQSRERKGSVINEEDAWKKIKMARDEADADKFRDDKLLEHCWEIWLLGYQWLITTNQQVAEARDNVILGSALRRWRNATASLMGKQKHAITLGNTRCLRAALTLWKAKLKEKRQIAWRNDMRVKMKATREKRDLKIQKDAWAKWRQSFRSHLSELQYNERIVLRFFLRWKSSLSKLDCLETAADHFYRRSTCSAVMQTWKRWKRALAVSDAEKAVTAKISLRINREVMQVWKKHAYDHQTATGFYDVHVMKQAIRSWKTARDRIRGKAKRADKHLARQDDVLIRAVTRVWKARERGKLLERVRALRLIQGTWSVWRERMRQHRRLEDCALAFGMRSNSSALSSTLETWRQVYTVYQNRRAFAIQRHLARIQYDALLKWRVQLRTRLKLLKHAKIVGKFIVQRRTLNVWKSKLAEKKRQNKLKALETCRLGEYMKMWQAKANRRCWHRTAEEQITTRVNMRMLADALSRWTNRVIEVKLRELEVRQKYSQAVLKFAFNKWKNICLRHVEDLSLMESHLDIKRAGRSFSSRRSIDFTEYTDFLNRKHAAHVPQMADFDRASMQVAWDRWREKYMEEKLHPIVHQVAQESQKNLLFRAFGIWHSKTRSLPAIRFRASRTKTKIWEIWRAAMPQALLAKKAREVHTTAVLSRAFEKWSQAYKTKRHLKEIARARYLRLPTMTNGPPVATSKPTGALVLKATRNAYSRRNAGTETETEDSDAGPSRLANRSDRLTPKPGIVSLLSSRPRVEPVTRSRPKSSTRGREPSPARSKSSAMATDEPPPSPRPRFSARRNPSPARSKLSYREPSPARSVAPAQSEPERSRLWQELRQVRLRSRPPTEKSRSPEPPP